MRTNKLGVFEGATALLARPDATEAERRLGDQEGRAAPSRSI